MIAAIVKSRRGTVSMLSGKTFVFPFVLTWLPRYRGSEKMYGSTQKDKVFR